MSVLSEAPFLRPGLPAFGHAAGTLVPGVALTGMIAAAAVQASAVSGVSPVLLALVGGAMLGFLRDDGRIAPGATFASKTLLRIAVALLGASVSLADLRILGPDAVAIALGAVVLTVGAGYAVSRWVGLGSTQAVVASCAVGICGASAALAVSAALPRRPGQDQTTAATVAVVTAVSSAAMIAYPLIATALGMDGRQEAIFLGATLHEMAHAAGAGYAVSPDVGALTVIVKLLRVACLAPIVFLVGAMAHRGADVGGRRPPTPWFLFGFAAFAAAGAVGWIPPEMAQALSASSKAMMLMAVVALGMCLSPSSLMRGGLRTLGAVTIVSALMATGVAWAVLR